VGAHERNGGTKQSPITVLNKQRRGQSDYLSDLTGLSFLVLDEADRMVEKGHFKEVDLILDAIDRVAASSKMFPLSDNSGNDAAGESTLRKPKPFKKARIIRRGAAEGNGEGRPRDFFFFFF